MFGNWTGGMMGYFGWGGMALGLVTVFLLIVAVVFGVRYLSNLKQGSSPETALEILRKRYAKGEITKEEFTRIKQDLEG